MPRPTNTKAWRITSLAGAMLRARENAKRKPPNCRRVSLQRRAERGARHDKPSRCVLDAAQSMLEPGGGPHAEGARGCVPWSLLSEDTTTSATDRLPASI